MLWAVAGRFGFDATNWAMSRLEFWYRGHVFMHVEESEAIEKAREVLTRGRI
jgi:hypothetical protein